VSRYGHREKLIILFSLQVGGDGACFAVKEAVRFTFDFSAMERMLSGR
jgi:hypothetical protein